MLMPQETALVASGAINRLQRVIAVDDDDFFREMLTQELAEFGISVEAFPDAQSLLANPNAFDDAELILLDWSLAQSCGLDLLPQIRRLGINLPVVILTGRALASNEMQAFDYGATDFIDKARGIPVLIRRLKNVVASKPAAFVPEKTLKVGDLLMKLKVSRGFWKGTDLNLTVGEFRIIHLLASRAGEHVSYRDIYDCMHYPGFCAGTGEDGYRTNVRSSIKRIRGKFRDADSGADPIENYAGFGYVWKAVEG